MKLTAFEREKIQVWTAPKITTEDKVLELRKRNSKFIGCSLPKLDFKYNSEVFHVHSTSSIGCSWFKRGCNATLLWEGDIGFCGIGVKLIFGFAVSSEPARCSFSALWTISKIILQILHRFWAFSNFHLFQKQTGSEKHSTWRSWTNS